MPENSHCLYISTNSRPSEFISQWGPVCDCVQTPGKWILPLITLCKYEDPSVLSRAQAFQVQASAIKQVQVPRGLSGKPQR